jgi:hypothetical protein
MEKEFYVAHELLHYRRNSSAECHRNCLHRLFHTRHTLKGTWRNTTKLRIMKRKYEIMRVYNYLSTLNSWPTKMQLYRKNTQPILNKIIDDLCIFKIWKIFLYRILFRRNPKAYLRSSIVDIALIMCFKYKFKKIYFVFTLHFCHYIKKPTAPHFPLFQCGNFDCFFEQRKKL